jgi:hypothetical protein
MPREDKRALTEQSKKRDQPQDAPVPALVAKVAGRTAAEVRI